MFFQYFFLQYIKTQLTTLNMQCTIKPNFKEHQGTQRIANRHTFKHNYIQVLIKTIDVQYYASIFILVTVYIINLCQQNNYSVRCFDINVCLKINNCSA
jgi:hypothetical protein